MTEDRDKWRKYVHGADRGRLVKNSADCTLFIVVRRGWLCCRSERKVRSGRGDATAPRLPLQQRLGYAVCTQQTAAYQRQGRGEHEGRQGPHSAALRHTSRPRHGHQGTTITSDSPTRSQYSITERRLPRLIPVLGSQPAGDVSHVPDGRLPLLSARPAVTLATLKRAATNFAAW